MQKRLRASYRLNCSQTDLATDLPMICKFKFVRYSRIEKKTLSMCLSSILTVLQSPKCPISKSKIFQFLSSGYKICFCCRTKSFEARGPIFWNQALHLAILESYDGTVTESTHNRDFGGEGIPPHAYLSSETKEVPKQFKNIMCEKTGKYIVLNLSQHTL